MSRGLRICSYEDRMDAMDSVILMGESLCRADPGISLHLTVPDAPRGVREWAATRPEVILTTERPDGVSGWDVKAWLMLRKLDSGCAEVLWMDTDMIVMRPVTRLLGEFPPGVFIVAEEWDSPRPEEVAHLWDTPPARAVTPVNSCFIRATTAHRALLERWMEKTRDPGYRRAQALPFERRPWRLASDQALLSALLGSGEFSGVPFASIRMGKHIAQCAGSSGYRPGDRLRDLVRGLPPMIHCIGRKPWTQTGRGFGIDFATDVSAYVLAARKVAHSLGMHPPWLDARTSPGAVLRTLAGGHPALAGLPLAAAHALYRGIVHTERYTTQIKDF